MDRSSRPELFCKKGVLRNFAKFTGKHLCQSLFFNKETLAQVFSCEFCEISKNTFFYRTPLVAASACMKNNFACCCCWLHLVVNYYYLKKFLRKENGSRIKEWLQKRNTLLGAYNTIIIISEFQLQDRHSYCK